ncbi:hypothetical protein [Tsukamurella pseudospumae]|uniref:Uncharacterized protein n=1 Tax=Tsukamurella pseudospumae TaxID=239498 RepID=A0A137ZRS0_9ACTN|nr:hypothetical protein [Tsukamurella pseudospumae]KXP00881.1 hypothetical protein AXK61_12800 [Tsukamurella pseudospumae]
MPDTRTVVTVHPSVNSVEARVAVLYPLCDTIEVDQQGNLSVYTDADGQSGVVHAVWAPGTWERAEAAEA